jgi:phospholipid/cholesterol/gamma-HCH transport system substrate-binding protein
METDKRYFVEGLFVIGLTITAILFFVWLAKSGHRDDVAYRIRFAESVSGLSRGDPVKYHGVDVGTVQRLVIDPDDPRLVLVDVALSKEAPVKTDTRASLRLKGLTGVVFIDLEGGAATAKPLLAATPQGRVPEIPSEKSALTSVLDQLPKVAEELPKVLAKFSRIENQAHQVLSDVGEVTNKVKENPSLLLRPPKKDDKQEDKPPADTRNPRH